IIYTCAKKITKNISFETFWLITEKFLFMSVFLADQYKWNKTVELSDFQIKEMRCYWDVVQNSF
ncbi:MAG: hypothetical protein L0L22_00675, partial [Staphylococcus equorum]|nr:hypothetical protein [Staphylococcus equorum]